MGLHLAEQRPPINAQQAGHPGTVPVVFVEQVQDIAFFKGTHGFAQGLVDVIRLDDGGRIG